MDCKYIVIAKDDRELMFVFPASIVHAVFAGTVLGMTILTPGRRERPYMYYQVISAGFVSPDNTCHGGSESLDVKARPDVDTALLKKGMES